MKIYKYRVGTKNDLKAINENYFWASWVEELNDPFESLLNTEEVVKGLNLIARHLFPKDNMTRILKENTQQVLNNKRLFSVYSLSEDFKNELLWAHYANNHMGFCIEFDLKKLEKIDGEKNYKSAKVIYTKRPPKIRILDLFNLSEEQNIQKKVAFYKSKSWAYEKEHRIISSKHGINHHSFRAITGIYFGIRISKKLKNELFKLLENHCVDFYQMKFKENSYEIEAEKIKSQYGNDPFKNLVDSNKMSRYNPKLLNDKIHNLADISEFNISFSSPPSKNKIIRFSKIIKETFVPNIKFFFINYLDEKDNFLFTVKFENDKITLN